MISRLNSSIALAALALTAQTARADIMIGLSLPLEGQYELISSQVIGGANDAVKALNKARAKDDQIKLIVADDSCNEEGGAAAARALINANAQIIIGHLCYRALAGAQTELKLSGIATITAHVRHPHWRTEREMQGWPSFSIAGDFGADGQYAVDVLSKRWKNKPYALVTDGGVYGRAFGEKVLRGMEAIGDPPDHIDDFRPLQTVQRLLTERLEKAGVEAALIGGDGEDIAVIKRGALEAGLDMEMVGGESLAILPYTGINLGKIDGLLAILPVMPETPASKEYDRAALAKGVEPAEAAKLGYALVQVAAASEVRPASGVNYSTILGNVTFDANGIDTIAPYRLHVWQEKTFIPLGNPAGSTGGVSQ